MNKINLNEFFNIVNQNIILSGIVYGTLMMIITAIISVPVWIIAKIIKKPVSFFVIYKLIYRFFLFFLSVIMGKDKSQISNKKHEKEEEQYATTWTILEELIASVKGERPTSQQKYLIDGMTKDEKILLSDIKKAFLDCVIQWNIVYNEMIKDNIFETKNMSELRTEFKSRGKEITDMLESKKDIPKLIIDKIVNCHLSKLNKYIDFFLDKAIDEIIIENIKIKKHVILNVWVYGLTLFIEDRDYFMDMIINKHINITEIKAKELKEEEEELNKKRLELEKAKNNL